MRVLKKRFAKSLAFIGVSTLVLAGCGAGGDEGTGATGATGKYKAPAKSIKATLSI